MQKILIISIENLKQTLAIKLMFRLMFESDKLNHRQAGDVLKSKLIVGPVLAIARPIDDCSLDAGSGGNLDI